MQAGRVAQSVARLAKEPEVLGSIPGPATYFRFSFRWFKKQKGQLSVTGESMSTKYWLTTKRSRNCVIRLTDRADMTIGAYLEV